MLKIGTVQWKGKCARHSFYKPDEDGEAGIMGGCQRCASLLAISQQHTRLVQMMREFGSSDQRRKPRAKAEAGGGYQTFLFDMPDPS
jgi:hypothetical protein